MNIMLASSQEIKRRNDDVIFKIITEAYHQLDVLYWVSRISFSHEIFEMKNRLRSKKKERKLMYLGHRK